MTVTGPPLVNPELPGPDLRAELMMSGTEPPGGFQRTTAVLEERAAGRYLAIRDSGSNPGLRRFLSSWWRLTLSWGILDLEGSLRLLWGGKGKSSQLED